MPEQAADNSRLSISGGIAGNAEQEALDVFSALDLTNMAAIDTVSLSPNTFN